MGCFSPSETKSQSSTEAKTERQKLELEKAFDLYSKEWGVGPEIYPGSRVTPFSTLQQGAVSGAGNFSDYFATPQTAGTPLNKETGWAIQDLLAGQRGATKMGAQDVQDYFQATIKDPTMKSLRGEVLPGIEESFSGPGFYGSARSQAKSDAITDTRDLLSEQWAGLNWNVLQQNQGIDEAKAGRTQQAVSQGMAYGQVPAQEIKNNLEIAAKQIGGLGEVFGFGQAEQTQKQMELQDEIMKFAEANQITDPENLEILLTLLGMNFSRSSSSGSQSGPGLGYVGASAAMS